MPDNKPPEPQPPRFQFGMAVLFLLTALCSVLAAIFSGLLRNDNDAVGMPPGFFILMGAAAPVAILILLSLARSAILWWKRRQRP
jgi:ABC-type transport system involved in multi-copper enzyme maturation permease subunit